MTGKTIKELFAVCIAARSKSNKKTAPEKSEVPDSMQHETQIADMPADAASFADTQCKPGQPGQDEKAVNEAGERTADTRTVKEGAKLSFAGFCSTVQRRYNQFGGMMIIPLSCLACAGLLMVMADLLARLAVPFSDPLLQAGMIVFRYAPLLFAAGIVNSLITHEKGLAVLAAILSTLVWTATATAVSVSVSATILQPVYNLGWLTGIASGFMTFGLFRFTERKIRSPRLTRLINPHTLVIWQIPLAVIGGSLMALLWLQAERVLSRTAIWIFAGEQPGLFIYGLLNRLLLPFGLHHILDESLWQQAGDYTTQSGQLIQGDLQRFLAGDPTAGQYTAGFFPVMLVVVPAMLLAIWLAGRSVKRPLPVMLLAAAAVLSFAGGITEPADYLIFLFSPLLYIVYAILAGLSMVAAAQLQVLHGFTFSAGLIDYLAWWSQATRPVWLLPLGAALGVIAFVIFWLTLRYFRGMGPDQRLEQAGFWRKKTGGS